jgi:hypothetical protein
VALWQCHLTEALPLPGFWLQNGSVDIPPRPLTDSERAILDRLLEPDFGGAEELRQQASGPQVVGQCDCGCPTIDLAVSPESPRSPIASNVSPVEARVTPLGDEPPGDLLLFLRDGCLASLEYVYYTCTPPDRWPDAERIDLLQS